jgi:hypothetical protein
MSVHVKKFRAALKHGAFSATAILPGEDPAAFKKTHEDIIAELVPDGALEDEIVWTIARLVWRKKNFATLRKGACTRASVANPSANSVGRRNARGSNASCGGPGPERPRSQLRAS